ncbi:MAG: hypothetical protein BWX86_02467 [Verrucomicrobia bacterium ADurb.Bin122]|nr:MAG: hypothetical protein BWX86_02467 [Verrucomicrobia bacterium ADurb.Bin122]
MRVVELHGHLVGKVVPRVGGTFAVAADDVVQRAGDEEVLLHQAQLFAVFGLIVRIKHLGNGLALCLFAHRLDPAAAVEGFEVKLLGGFRGPQAQEVHRLGAVAHDRNVVGHAEDALRLHPAGRRVAAVVEIVDHLPIEVDFQRVLRAADFPRITVDQPVVGMLDLVAIDELLLEQAVLVVDAVADGRVVVRGERIEEARGEAAETAVAQAHVLFQRAHGLEVHAERAHGLLRILVQAGVVQIGAEQTAHEILQREVVEAADILGVVHALRLDHALHDVVAHSHRRGNPPVARGRRMRVARQRRFQVAEDQRTKHFRARIRRDARGHRRGGFRFRGLLVFGCGISSHDKLKRLTN